MAADFRSGEELISCDVVAMMMRVDQASDRFAAADLLGAGDEILRLESAPAARRWPACSWGRR
jgi:hypothetical protein